jgi:hypothetical protein
MVGKFPMSCIYGHDSGIALGIDGSQYFSYLESGGNAQTRFHYAVQLVIDPAKQGEVCFLIYDFKATYKYLNALQIYYGIFPELFIPAKGCDPRLGQLGGYVRAPTNRTYWEACRRFYVGWEWIYGPFQKTGLWYPRADEWDCKRGTHRTFPPKPRLQFYQLNKYRSKLRERYDNARWGCVAANYIIPRLCEVETIKKKFPDSRLLTITGSYVRGGSVKGHGEQSQMMYAYGNSFGKRTLGDIEKIAKDYKPGGFGFDEAAGITKNYEGKGVEVSPGRAFLEDVIYTLQGVAYAKCMEKVHSLKGDNGYCLSVIGNTPEVYLTAFRCDAIMYENPYYVNTNKLLELRRLTGKKTIGLWEGYSMPYSNKTAPVKIAGKLRKLIKGTILFSFSTGVLPGLVHTKGFPEVYKAIPALLALAKAGWQPVPAMLTDRKITLGRFGSGTSTYLSLVNKSNSEFAGKVIVENEYLGNYSYFFVKAFKDEDIKLLKSSSLTSCRLFPKKTELTVKIPANSALILKAAGGFKFNNGSIAVKTKLTNAKTVAIKALFSKAGIADFKIGSLDKAHFTSLYIDGKKYNFEIADKGVAVKNYSWKQNNQIVARYAPDIMLLNSKVTDILNFPFTQKGKPDCILAVGDKASEKELVAANRIAAYFEYYYMRTKKAKIMIPVKKASEISIDKNVNIVLLNSAKGNDLVRKLSSRGYQFSSLPSATKGIIQLLNNHKSPRKILYLSGDIEKTTFALLKMLDKKYTYYGICNRSTVVKHLKSKGLIPELVFE